MADRITIELDAREVLAGLHRLLAATGPGGLAPALKEIGEDLVESTKRRFETSTAPDGSRWAPNAQATFASYLARRDDAAKLTRKDGRLNKRGAAVAANKRPLVESGILQDTIAYQVEGDSLFVGTNRFAGEWDGGAAVHQFGSRNGKIPARPFLGLSPDDEAGVLDVIDRHLRAALG